ncbi:hypothetical protein [Lysobacter terrae]
MGIRNDWRVRCVATLAAALALAPAAMAQQRTAPQPVFRQIRPVATQAAPQAAVIEPPPGLAAQVPASAVVLRPGNSATTLQSLRITRQHGLAQLRAQPMVTVQAGKVDFKPVLSNPQALFNVAQRLRAEPQLAEVTADETQVLEVEQGLVVRSFLGYRLRMGACLDRARRAQLANTAVRCFTQMTPQARAAAFANPSDPHYVADPGQRAIALHKAEEKAAEVRAEVSSDIASLRTMLADPAQRTAIEAEIGAGEAARLASLGDAQLEAEVVNAGETRIEQVMFVPTRGSVDRTRFSKVIDLGGAQASADGSEPLPGWMTRMKVQEGPALPPIAVIQTEKSERPIEPRVFLTGFTLGREYEWRQRVETTIKWCLVGCKKTYYVELYAGFNYGFGLRFPLTMGGTYRYQKTGTSEKAWLVTDFRTIDGSPADYAAAGLPGSQMFSGKELVAQFGAYAGAAYKVPIFGSGNARADLGKDFTEGLPAPFTNGQFRAPMPGEGMEPLEKIFTDFDLIGGRANFGVVGGQVFPALKAQLHSDALRFTLHDNIAGTDVPVTTTGQEVPLAVNAGTSDFTIGNPVYNLGFLLTPGIDARLFIDIEVWSDHWDWPIWFPQLAVELPPGGVDFACHSDTVCTRNYRMSSTGSIETTGAGGKFIADLDGWTKNFETVWAPDCADDICRTGIKLVRLDTFLRGKQIVEAATEAKQDPPPYDATMKPIYEKADATAKGLIHDSQIRLTQKAGKGWAILAQEVWSKRCSDVPCMTNVAALADQMVQAAVERQQAQPDASSLAVQGEIGREFGAKFQAEINASKTRSATQAVLLKMQPVQTMQMQTLPTMRRVP